MATDPLTVLAEGERLLAACSGPASFMAAIEAAQECNIWLRVNAPALLAVARAAAETMHGAYPWDHEGHTIEVRLSDADDLRAALQRLTETDQ